MRRIKSFISIISIIAFIFPPRSTYGQAGIPAGGMAETEAAVSKKETPYVKPGYVTVNFKDADIRVVLDYLSEVSGVDIVPSPDVTGAISLKLTDKPWQVALDIIVKNYGYAYEREADIIRVVTISSLKLEELTTEVIPLSYISAENAQQAVKDMLTPRGKLSLDARVNALVVSDIATNIYRIKQVIQKLDKKTPQIMIEAKIIETTLSKSERLGIDWNLVIGLSGAGRPTTLPFDFRGELGHLGIPPDVWNTYMPRVKGTVTTAISGEGIAVTTTDSDFPLGVAGTGIEQGHHSPFPFALSNQFTYGTLSFTQFYAILEYLKSRTGTDIISNPRITTLNNKQAKMYVGRVHPYISKIDEDEEKGRIKYEYKEKEIGIKLLVTPHLNPAGDIEVEVKPEISDIVGYQALTEWFSLPIFSTREAETQVMVRDGDTIFIGGLIKENVKAKNKKFPILGDLLGEVPYIGNMFKYKSESRSKTELIFFLTVHIVKDVDRLTASVIEDLSEVSVPLDISEKALETPGFTPGKEGVSIELPTPIYKKEHKPLFDFRKRKKK